MNGDEKSSLHTSDIHDENTYPLQHNAYSTETVKETGSSTTTSQNDDNQSTSNTADDEDDDDGYIDMSKNSFRKPVSPKVVSGADVNASSAMNVSQVPKCSDATVKLYEDNLISNTSKILTYEKYHHSDSDSTSRRLHADRCHDDGDRNVRQEDLNLISGTGMEESILSGKKSTKEEEKCASSKNTQDDALFDAFFTANASSRNTGSYSCDNVSNISSASKDCSFNSTGNCPAVTKEVPDCDPQDHAAMVDELFQVNIKR